MGGEIAIRWRDGVGLADQRNDRIRTRADGDEECGSEMRRREPVSQEILQYERRADETDNPAKALERTARYNNRRSPPGRLVSCDQTREGACQHGRVASEECAGQEGHGAGCAVGDEDVVLEQGV